MSDQETIYPPQHNPKWWRQHPELWAQALKAMPPPKTHKEPEPRASWLGTARHLFGPGFIVGGLGVMSKDLFMTGCCIVYFGCLLLYLETVFEPFFIRKSLELQCLCIAASLLIPAWFTESIVVYPSLIDDYASWYVGNYSVGSNVDGIIWQEGMSELRLGVHNPTSRDYSNVDIQFLVSDTVIDIKQLTDLPCHRLEETRMWVDDTAGNVFHPLGQTFVPQRMWCDKLPSHSTVEFMIPIGNAEDSLKTHKPSNGSTAWGLVFGKKRKPSLSVHIYYDGLLKRNVRLDNGLNVR